MSRRARASFLLIPCLTIACGGSDPFQGGDTVDRLSAWTPGPTATILRSDTSRLHVPMFAIVTDTGTWRTVWNQAWAGEIAPPSLPFEDFVLSSVIVLGLGNRVGPGYSVVIDSVVSYTSGQVLFATEYLPPHPCPGTAERAPVHMLRVIDHPPLMEHRIARIRRACPA